MELRTYPDLDGFGRQILSIPLQAFGDFPTDITLPSSHFVCLIVAEATEIPDDVIAHLAGALLDKGLGYLCAWGPDCSRVHDVFDITIVRRKIEQGIDYPVPTSWHSKESLDEALWFVLICAYPDDRYAETCNCTLIITVGNADWTQQVQRRLANLGQLTLDVVRE